jgi:DNA polymerase III subunit alpha
MQFSHLHNHTQFSLLDGASSIPKLFKKAIDDNMPAIAITDHGNMFGVFDFVKNAYKHKNEDGSLKVKPIVGCEFYLVDDRTITSFKGGGKDVRYHQLLLAKNEDGYKNLTILCSLGFTEGLYGKFPRIDKQLLEKYKDGLIATTCCLGASVPRTILRDGEEAGEKEFKWWLDLFGEDYYVEFQRHGIPDQEKVNEVLIKFARKYNVKIIASNDSHYLDQEDFNAHDILLCVNMGAKQSTPSNKSFSEDEEDTSVKKRFAFENDQFFFKTQNQMIELFKDLPEAIDNTNEIVAKIDPFNLVRDILLPHFKTPDLFKTQDDYLEFLTWEGAKMKYKIITPEVDERIKFELGVIKQMGFAGYFLIVSDFILAGKNMGVYIGPGRGSAAGSVVAYCTGITNIDPIKYNLLFERFLNPDRKSMPDIDTDFDDVGRQKVMDYVAEKYGKDRVAHIVTYGKMAAKSVIKDVARVMDMPLDESVALTKLVPDKPGINLGRLLHAPLKGAKSLIEKEDLNADDMAKVMKLRETYETPGNLKYQVLHEAEKLEGTVRNTGIHAAGIIIAPTDLKTLLPVFKSKDVQLLVTQYEGSIIEDAGVIKMDFLGLKNLTILKDALELIKENHGVEIILDDLPLDDEKTFQLYQAGATNATFQFESPGMQKHLINLKPDKFMDLIAMNALYRPGPIAYIPDFIARKNGKQAVTYDLPAMEEYLSETYGITVYQEQVMLLSQKLANFSKGDADILRKAMGKKQIEVLNKMKTQFIDGCTLNEHPLDKVEKIWKDWEAFAQYAFNKSHSTCYAYVAYQTAYLKAHYPSEYMAAVLNSQNNIESISTYMEECQRMGLKVTGPDINESKAGFAVNKDGIIRFGLEAVKGIGEAAVEDLIKERKANGDFTDIFNLVQRINSRTVNKKSLESLSLAGGFDSWNQFHRAQLMQIPIGELTTNLEKIIKYGQQYQASKDVMANSLFGGMEDAEITLPKILDCEKWGISEMLDKEKEVLGMYITAHPLDAFKRDIQVFKLNKITDVMNPENNGIKFRFACYVSNSREFTSKKGTLYSRSTVIDYSGQMDISLYTNNYANFGRFFVNGQKIIVEGVMELMTWANPDNPEPRFNIHNVQLLETVKSMFTKRVQLEMDVDKISEAFIKELHFYVRNNPGNTELAFTVNDPSNKDLVNMRMITKLEAKDELFELIQKYENVQYRLITN